MNVCWMFCLSWSSWLSLMRDGSWVAQSSPIVNISSPKVNSQGIASPSNASKPSHRHFPFTLIQPFSPNGLTSPNKTKSSMTFQNERKKSKLFENQQVIRRMMNDLTTRMTSKNCVTKFKGKPHLCLAIEKSNFGQIEMAAKWTRKITNRDQNV